MLNEVNLIGTIEKGLHEKTINETNYISFSLRTWSKFVNEETPKYSYSYHLVRIPKDRMTDLQHHDEASGNLYQIKGEAKSYKNKKGQYVHYIDSYYFKHLSSLFGDSHV